MPNPRGPARASTRAARMATGAAWQALDCLGFWPFVLVRLLVRRRDCPGRPRNGRLLAESVFLLGEPTSGTPRGSLCLPLALERLVFRVILQPCSPKPG